MAAATRMCHFLIATDNKSKKTDKEDDISSYNIQVDVISIQETRSFYYPEMVHLPGVQPIIFSGRSGMRGGGVGFYIVRGCTSTD